MLNYLVDCETSLRCVGYTIFTLFILLSFTILIDGFFTVINLDFLHGEIDN